MANGSADMGIGNIPMTIDKREIVDFTIFMHSLNMYFLVGKPKEIAFTSKFIAPFTWQAWVAVLLALIMTSLVTMIAILASLPSNMRKKEAWNSFFLCYKLQMQQQGNQFISVPKLYVPKRCDPQSNVHSSVVERWTLTQRTWVRIQPRKIIYFQSCD